MKSTKLQPQQNVVQVGNVCIYSGTQMMVTGAGGPIQRSTEVWLPLFVGQPDVTATVFSEESVGIAFAIFQIQVNRFEDISQTQIAIAAQNVNPENVVDYTYWCSYVVIGQPQEDSKPVKK
jgi:hypothetical protein